MCNVKHCHDFLDGGRISSVLLLMIENLDIGCHCFSNVIFFYSVVFILHFASLPFFSRGDGYVAASIRLLFMIILIFLYFVCMLELLC